MRNKENDFREQHRKCCIHISHSHNCLSSWSFQSALKCHGQQTQGLEVVLKIMAHKFLCHSWSWQKDTYWWHIWQACKHIQTEACMALTWFQGLQSHGPRHHLVKLQHLGCLTCSCLPHFLPLFAHKTTLPTQKSVPIDPAVTEVVTNKGNISQSNSQHQCLTIQRRNHQDLANFWPVHCVYFVCSLLIKYF